MKRCIVCKSSCEERELYEGILEDGMVLVCSGCSDTENIPLIRKPSQEQLKKADERHSVRERMEKLSGAREATEISGDQMALQGNLAKLRLPTPKEQNDTVLDNYYWKLNMARRRKKLSLTQLSEVIKIPRETLSDIEKGKIPKDFEELFLKLESFLGIKLLKEHDLKVNFTRNIDREKELLERVHERMGREHKGEEDVEEADEIESKEERLNKIESGEIDFSKREALSDVTLNDLVDMKKEKQEKEREVKIKRQNEAMFGDDLEFEED
jgi:ribosome-binding protein aMBF1 (putative translation factor)